MKDKEWRWLTTDEEHPHGAEGVSVDRLTGKYCRGKFEATACVERLHEYEELRLTPDEIRNMQEKLARYENDEIREMWEKLDRYEKAEKDGRIAVLRYKIGDSLTPEPRDDLPSRLKITGIKFKKEEEKIYLVYEGKEIGRDGLATGRKFVLRAMPEDFPYLGENDGNGEAGESNDSD